MYKEKEEMLIGTLNNLNQPVTRKKYPPARFKNYKVDLICELEALDFLQVTSIRLLRLDKFNGHSVTFTDSQIFISVFIL